jgi:hypothetical protein
VLQGKERDKRATDVGYIYLFFKATHLKWGILKATHLKWGIFYTTTSIFKEYMYYISGMFELCINHEGDNWRL